MAKVKGGLQGTISGTVGGHVFYTVGDEQFVKAKAQNPNKFSENQEANQKAFGGMQGWLTPIGFFLKIGCKNEVKFKGGHALALEYMSANAVTGEGDDRIIHPEKVRVSIGTLPGSSAASVEAEGQEAVFTWDTGIGFGAEAFDQVLVLAYDVEQKTVFSFVKGYFRRDGSLRLPISRPGRYHCYLGFVAQDYSRQSNSQYLGLLEF